MKADTKLQIIRTIDRYLGPLLLSLFSAWMYLDTRFEKRMYFNALDSYKGRKKFLIIKFFGIGSIINSALAIDYLKTKHSGCKVDFLTFAENREICSLIKGIDEVKTVKITIIEQGVCI